MSTSDRERRLGLELPAWLTPILLTVIGCCGGFWLNKMDTSVDQIKDSQARIETRELEAREQHEVDIARATVTENRVQDLTTRVSVLESTRHAMAAGGEN